MDSEQNLTGKTFGRLTVLRQGAGKDYKSGRKPSSFCQCACGNTVDVLTASLRAGRTNSCGCLQRELSRSRRLTHGASTSLEYGIWQSMLNRCRNPNTPSYKYYGAKGIAVCRRWLKFENFIGDMGVRPSESHSIERQDTAKGYSPGNCHWALQEEQSRNRSDTFLITYAGQTKHLTAWRRDGGIPKHLLNRLVRGWSLKEATEIPKGKRRHPKRNKGRRHLHLIPGKLSPSGPR